MSQPKVRLFTATGCAPCEELKPDIDAGRVRVQVGAEDGELDVVDITTDEGFALLEQISLEAVPRAYFNNRQCLITQNEDGVVISCPGEAAPPD